MSEERNQTPPTTQPTQQESLQKSPKSRMTVVETVYFAAPGEDPFAIGSTYSRIMQSGEYPYSRKVKVTEEWQKLDCGSILEAGLLILSNDENKGLQVNPTAKEKAEAKKRIIEVGYLLIKSKENRDMFSEKATQPAVIPLWLILPGETMRGQPLQLDCLMLRCQSGVAKCTINIMPL